MTESSDDSPEVRVDETPPHAVRDDCVLAVALLPKGIQPAEGSAQAGDVAGGFDVIIATCNPINVSMYAVIGKYTCNYQVFEL